MPGFFFLLSVCRTSYGYMNYCQSQSLARISVPMPKIHTRNCISPKSDKSERKKRRKEDEAEMEVDKGRARGREEVWAKEILGNKNGKGTRELEQRKEDIEIMLDRNLDPVTRNSGDLQTIDLGLWLLCNRGTVMADRNPKCEAAETGGHATTQVLDSRLILLSRHCAFGLPQESTLTGSGTRNWRTGRVKSRRRGDLRTGWGRSQCRWAGRLCWGRARAPAAGSGCPGSPSELQRDRESESERPEPTET